ncbi:hypothetical protein AB205_0151350, partial [Aquarana catesbeiana]
KYLLSKYERIRNSCTRRELSEKKKTMDCNNFDEEESTRLKGSQDLLENCLLLVRYETPTPVVEDKSSLNVK